MSIEAIQTNSYSKEIEASKKVVLPYIGPKGLAEIFSKDTIGKAPPTVTSEISKPKLDHPSCLAMRMLDFQKRLDQTLQDQLTHNQTQFEKKNKEFETLIQQHMEAMQKAMQQKASHASWQTFQTVATTTSILCCSAAAVATGGAGVTLFVLTSGGLTLANTAMKHFGGWEAIASRISQDPAKQESLQKTFEWGAQGLAIIFGLAGLGGTLATHSANLWVQNAAELGKKGTTFLSALSQIASGASEMRIYSSQVKQIETESLLFQQKGDKEKFAQSTETLMTIEENIAEKVGEIIKSRTQILRQITSSGN
ncbi:MAG: hypothetical protein WCP39_01010 [Chlamydiota bacterium]